MTAYNVVRFRVKPGMEDAFIDSQRKSLEGDDLPGAIDAALIKTGDRSYCFVGKWDKFESIVAARPTMIGFLDEVRPYLEDLGNGLGVTPRKSSQVSAAATGTATTTRARCNCRTASAAARIVAPVASPSSTRMTVCPPRRAGRGRHGRPPRAAPARAPRPRPHGGFPLR